MNEEILREVLHYIYRFTPGREPVGAGLRVLLSLLRCRQVRVGPSHGPDKEEGDDE